ncbi:hypothetical protein [Cellulomonas fimi]|uniref:DUF4190 domain-containing protein n=1 Tax=Cellulomonas fimi (strain ATCC 484 / DSM 20113 / JCM 1341 / CCUG 24087 / LMG 16345 / NBRC 15513 / NCIMB 8980 / NCTC 7547 / NRS-133) TaxID=590998 RepID=F4H6N5_CELFA|nr:hypothetical protein [Cellulomonas fimi]AEE46796.1 hypothetical protein Celf_2672 [Cellulomonas fimi ATCC 484]NNH09118.1 hypothetical protein [Cellulomonas fimi]VEH34211.1 Uncharacterised protein [Cellulomonas fimi]
MPTTYRCADASCLRHGVDTHDALCALCGRRSTPAGGPAEPPRRPARRPPVRGCVQEGCRRAGRAEPRHVCAVCGSPTVPLPPVRRSHVALVVVVTALPCLLGLVQLAAVGVLGAVPAAVATRRLADRGRRTSAYWVAFAATIVAAPVLVVVAVWTLFITTGLLGTHV